MKRRRDGSMCHRWRPIASALCAAALLLAPAEAQPAAHYGSGSVTYVSDVSRAGCGFVSWPRMAETHYAAVLPSSSSSPDNTAAAWTRRSRLASACGRCARVWCDDDDQQCRGRTSSAVVYIVEDQRTRWTANGNTGNNNNNNNNADVNLSPRVFRSLTGSDAGRVPLRWRFTDCPAFHSHNPETPEVPPAQPTATPPVGDEELAACAVCVRNDSSPYLVSLQPVNDTLGVVTVRVGGVRAARPWGSPSFFFSIADRFGRLDLTRLEISLTTRSRRRFARVVAVKPGACVAMRRSDEVLDGGVTPTSRVPPFPESPDNSDDDNDFFDDDDELYVSTLPPPPATRAPSRTSSFVVIPSRAPASADPAASPIVVPPVVPPSPVVSPIVRPAVRTVSPSEASPRPPTAPVAAPDASVTPVASGPAPTAPTPPAVRVVPTVTPTPVDKGGEWPPRDPGDDADVRTRPPPSPTTASTSAPSANAPQPTSGGRTPVGHLSGGVLTNPVFVGVLLGTVGLVGAVVAYRAKATQGARLALAPPVTSTAAAGAAGATTSRADFAAL